MSWTRLLPAATLATVVLGALVGTASANRLSVSTSAFRDTWTSAEFSGGFGTIRCSLTLEGSLHSATFTKTAGALVGFITRASVGPCASGSATILAASLPWHVQYESFAGVLPEIETTTTNVIGAAFQLEEPVFGITCLATSTTSNPIKRALKWLGHLLKKVRLSGTVRCGPLTATIGGESSTNSAMTLTLI